MPSFKGQLTDEADRGRDRVRRQGVRRRPERLSSALRLPDDFPRDVRVVATDFDRTLVWTDGALRPRTIARAAARARGRRCRVIVVTGRMVKSVRRALEPAGLAAPVICYQGAVVADERRALAAARADPARARARGDRRRPRRGGLLAERLRRRRALRRASDTPEARAYADLNRHRVPRRRRRSSTGSTSRRRSSCASAIPPCSTRSSRG